MAQAPAMKALRQAARRYRRAQDARNEALAALQQAICDADAEGRHTRAEIIEAAGVAKQTVYDALKGD